MKGETSVKAKHLKAWVNELPDDALILVLQSSYHSIPLPHPVFQALTDVKPEGGFMSGKVISSLEDESE